MAYSLWTWMSDETILQGFVAELSTVMLLAIISLSIALLSKGADWMIDGVVALANRARLSKIVIGATIVSLGTTLPEAFVSVFAAYMGNPGLALGNGVGSIIADTGLIFGLGCLIAVIPANRYILNRTGWVQVGAATLLVVIAVISMLNASAGSPPRLERWVGLLFLLLLGIYLYITYLWAKQSEQSLSMPQENETGTFLSLWISGLMVMGGLVLIIAGARILIPCASEIAVRFGVPDDVIAATLVAFGTSLPELVTAIAAIRKGYPEIMVGNIVGADVLNCLFVIGAAATAAPLEIPKTFYYFHFPAMLSILYFFRLFITMNRSGRFYRWQGAWLLSLYCIYIFLQYALDIGAAH